LIDEKLLIKQLQDKKSVDRAFRVLMGQYKERLYWHIRKIVLTHEDADDVLQNTFIKVYRNIHSFKAESKLYSWMYRIATNESITFINKRAKSLQIESEEMQQNILGNLEADTYFEGDEIQQKLQYAIAQLYKDMAEILDKSIGGLKANYHHAVKKIEKYLKSN